MLLIAVFYVAGITVVTMLAFAWDKICARNCWRRVPENTLLTLALVGGTAGAIMGLQILALAALSLQPVREAALTAIQKLTG